MPGTLSVELQGQTMLLHCLDTRQDVRADVAAAERRVARLFGLDPMAKEGS